LINESNDTLAAPWAMPLLAYLIIVMARRAWFQVWPNDIGL
jgi:hypothetical protein